MKQVIRDEARLLRLISGTLVKDGPVEVEGVAVCKGPGHCAMGALMFAAGFSNKSIDRFENGQGLGNYSKGPVARKLFDVYHIDEQDASAIITGNDLIKNNFWGDLAQHKPNVGRRMESVLRTIDSLPKRERIRPRLKASN